MFSAMLAMKAYFFLVLTLAGRKVCVCMCVCARVFMVGMQFSRANFSKSNLKQSKRIAIVT